MLVKVTKHRGYMCLMVDEPYVLTLKKIANAKYSTKWKCLVADWSSVACLKLKRALDKLAWKIQASPDFHHAIALLDPSKQAEARAKNAETLTMVQEFGLKNKLWNHQREAFLRVNGLSGGILDMGMGTGKSLTTIALILAGKHDFGMIVCPKSVIAVWPLEFQRHCAKDFHIYTGPKQKSATVAKFTKELIKEANLAKALNKPFIVVCNYEKIWQGDFAELIAKSQFDFIVYDEAHRLKSGGGTASKFAAKIRSNGGRIIGCTGTLLPHSPLDAFGVFRAVDPALFGSSYIPFRATYAVLGGFEGKQVVDFQNQKLMHDKIASLSYRVRSEDVLDLPPFQHIVRTFELSPAVRKTYDLMFNDLCAEHEGHTLTAANAMVKVLRLQQITSGIIPDECGNEVVVGRDKAELFADILSDIQADEPVVVFCKFTADIQVVKEIAAGQGREVYELSGKKNELKAWQDAGKGVIAVQIQAGKEGVDFTISNTVFYYSIGHSLGDYDQSLKRAHRPGQLRPVCYFHLVAKDTVDVSVYRSLDKKRDVVEYVLETLKWRE